MNHRKGRLTSRDFDPSKDMPEPQFFTDPIETDSGFGVVYPGSTFKHPAPDRDMWAMEKQHPWVFLVYASCFLLGASGVVRWFA